ncbi:MAG: polysaccharide biosynthesis tyrosine autokinase [Chloroflexi bacterium]|nr:polysaccharide biosynthesis tyrosine autokinase [Chloroflexota bacterium]
MELSQYLRIARKWLWLILLMAFIGGSAGFIIRSRQRQVYRAEVQLYVGPALKDPDPGFEELYVGQELVETYAVLAKNYETAQQAVNSGNFPISPEALRQSIDTRIIENTSLLLLGVTYTDPVLAADMANGVAEQLVLNSPASLTEEERVRIQELRDQIDSVRSQISDLEEERIDLATQQSDDTLTADELENVTERLDLINTQINAAVENFNNLNATLSALEGSNRVEISEPARIPDNPSGLNSLSATALGAVVAASLAMGFALLVEYLNNTFRTPEEVTSVLKLPVLGTITRFGKNSDSYAKRLVTHLQPTSPVAEGYRALRTNLMYSVPELNGGEKRAFIITSPGPEEGKSVTIANLAVAMATAGHQVLLVDADLRRPKQHLIFDLDNEVGLTTLLFSNPDDLNITGANAIYEKLERCIQPTSVPRLSVMTSGFPPTNPAEILGSALMIKWFHELLDTDFDILLFDSPPGLIVADASVLGATIGVPALMVVRAAKTHRSAGIRIKEQFDNLGIDIIGVAINHMNPADQGYGYGGSYYYYYGTQETVGATAWHRLTRWFNRSS